MSNKRNRALKSKDSNKAPATASSDEKAPPAPVHASTGLPQQAGPVSDAAQKQEEIPAQAANVAAEVEVDKSPPLSPSSSSSSSSREEQNVEKENEDGYTFVHSHDCAIKVPRLPFQMVAKDSCPCRYDTLCEKCKGTPFGFYAQQVDGLEALEETPLKKILCANSLLLETNLQLSESMKQKCKFFASFYDGDHKSIPVVFRSAEQYLSLWHNTCTRCKIGERLIPKWVISKSDGCITADGMIFLALNPAICRLFLGTTDGFLKKDGEPLLPEATLFILRLLSLRYDHFHPGSKSHKLLISYTPFEKFVLMGEDLSPLEISSHFQYVDDLRVIADMSEKKEASEGDDAAQDISDLLAKIAGIESFQSSSAALQVGAVPPPQQAIEQAKKEEVFVSLPFDEWTKFWDPRKGIYTPWKVSAGFPSGVKTFGPHLDRNDRAKLYKLWTKNDSEIELYLGPDTDQYPFVDPELLRSLLLSTEGHAMSVVVKRAIKSTPSESLAVAQAIWQETMTREVDPVTKKSYCPMPNAPIRVVFSESDVPNECLAIKAPITVAQLRALEIVSVFHPCRVVACEGRLVVRNDEVVYGNSMTSKLLSLFVAHKVGTPFVKSSPDACLNLAHTLIDIKNLRSVVSAPNALNVGGLLASSLARMGVAWNTGTNPLLPWSDQGEVVGPVVLGTVVATVTYTEMRPRIKKEGSIENNYMAALKALTMTLATAYVTMSIADSVLIIRQLLAVSSAYSVIKNSLSSLAMSPTEIPADAAGRLRYKAVFPLLFEVGGVYSEAEFAKWEKLAQAERLEKANRLYSFQAVISRAYENLPGAISINNPFIAVSVGLLFGLGLAWCFSKKNIAFEGLPRERRGAYGAEFEYKYGPRRRTENDIDDHLYDDTGSIHSNRGRWSKAMEDIVIAEAAPSEKEIRQRIKREKKRKLEKKKKKAKKMARKQIARESLGASSIPPGMAPLPTGKPKWSYWFNKTLSKNRVPPVQTESAKKNDIAKILNEGAVPGSYRVPLQIIAQAVIPLFNSNHEFLGTGFFVGNRLLTAAHAVNGSEEVYGEKPADKTLYKFGPAKMLNRDGYDIAVFAKGNFPAKSLAPPTKLLPMDAALDVLVPSWIPSLRGPELVCSGGRLYANNHLASTEQGSSGAPVIGHSGEVWGLHIGCDSGRTPPLNVAIRFKPDFFRQISGEFSALDLSTVTDTIYPIRGLGELFSQGYRPFPYPVENPPPVVMCTDMVQKLRDKKPCDPIVGAMLRDKGYAAKDLPFEFADHSPEAFTKALQKFCLVPSEYDLASDLEWRKARNWVARQYLSRISSCRVLSFEESLETLVPDTASGPIYRRWPKKEDVVKDLKPHLKRVYDEYFDEATRTPVTTFTATLKAEIRPIEKVRNKKTRLFTAAPVDHILVQNSLSTDFNGKMNLLGADEDFPSSVGCDLQRMLVSIGRRYAKTKHEEVFCADISAYDTRITQEMFNFCVCLRYAALKPDCKNTRNLKALATIYRDVWFTHVALPSGHIVVLPGGPSGHGSTAHDNTIILNVLFAWAYARHHPGSGYADYKQNLEIHLFGDDSVCFSGPGFKKTFVDTLALVKMEVEFAENLEYLGHSIVWSEELGTVVPYFPREKALASLFLSPGTNDKDQIARLCSIKDEVFADLPVTMMIEEMLAKLRDPYRESLGFFSMDNARFVVMDRVLQGGLRTDPAHKITLRNMKRNQPKAAAAKSRKPAGKRQSKADKTKAMVVRADAIARNVVQREKALIQEASTRSFPISSKASFAPTRPNTYQADKRIANYIDAVIDPVNKACRIPDAMAIDSAVITSNRVFDLPIYLRPNDATSGQFSFAVKPILGGSASPLQYQIALVNASAGWPIVQGNQNSLNSIYQSLVENQDLRFDPNMEALCQGPPGTWVYQSNSSLNDTRYFNVPGSTQNPADTGNPAVTSGSNLTVGTGLAGLPSPGNYFSLGPGQYKVIFETTTTLGTPVFTSSNGLQATVSAAQAPGYYSWDVFVPSVSVSGLQPQFQLNHSANLGVGALSRITISRTFNTTMPVSLESGLVRKLRPVAQTVLVTFTGATLVNGGNLAVARVPADTLSDRYFSNNISTTWNQPLQEYGNLSAVQHAYNGPLNEGAWAFWLADSSVDIEFKKPDQSIDHAFPAVVVSGKYVPNVPVEEAFVFNGVRVMINTTFEITTDTRLFEVASCIGLQSEVDIARHVLAQLPHGYANAWHTDLIAKVREFVKRGSAFYTSNKLVLDPLLFALKTAGAAALL